ncbi:unnamed protein product [Phaedon cochleariae]|uniref:MADF domain-containing protein n=1 Tax=Phaedon cochleariae TaxID=80249 RepID=A0A9P0GM49_PHACE|nr:unnamed protein product [Phaedon cochleariae]
MFLIFKAAECEARWATLRNLFTRESKKVKVVPSGSGGKGKTWVWLEEMGFLSEYVRRRKTKGNVSKPLQSQEIEDSSQSDNVWDTMSEIFNTNEPQHIEEAGHDENLDPMSDIELVSDDAEPERTATGKRKLNHEEPLPGTSTSTTPAKKSSPSISILRNERQEKRRKISQQSTLIETMNSAWSKFDKVINQSSQKEEQPDCLFGRMVAAELGSIENINVKFTAKQEIIKILHLAKNEQMQ